MNSKIFGIGLSRTGTTSLSAALEMLGFKSKHYPDFIMDNSSLITRLKARFNGNVWPIFKNVTWGSRNRLVLKKDEIGAWDALSDTPVARFFKDLDRYYPGSKFIYTIRDMDDWLKSCKTFFFPTRFDYWLFSQLHFDLYGVNTFNRGRFMAGYEKHDQNIKSYFKKREKDLLIMNICGGEGWEKLCPFLKIDPPDKKFPHRFKSHEAGRKTRYPRMK